MKTLARFAARTPGVRPWLVIWVTAMLSSGLAAADRCPVPWALLGKAMMTPARVAVNWVSPEEAREFSVTQLKKARRRYRQLLSSGVLTSADLPHTLEDKIAFLEMLRNQLAPRDAERISGELLRSFLTRRRLALAFDDIDFRSGITAGDVEGLMSELFVARHLSPESYLSLVQRGWTGSSENLIRLRFEERLAREGMVPALAALGILREPAGLERVDRLLHKAGPYLEAVIAAAALPTAVLVPPHLPGYLPQVRMLQREKLVRKIYETILAKGFEAAKPQIWELCGHPAQFDLAYSHLRSAFMAAVGMYFVAWIWQDERKRAEEQAKAVAQEAAQVMAEVNAITIRNQLNQSFESAALTRWRVEYVQKFGHPPAPEEEALIRNLLEAEGAPSP